MTKFEALEKEVLEGNTLEEYEVCYNNGQTAIVTGNCLLYCYLKNEHNTLSSWVKCEKSVKKVRKS